jgi:hypothetical protein
MKTNPEFKRNLWLQFSLHRLIAMPAVLGLTILAVGAAGSTEGVSNLVSAGFFILVWLWGTRAAAGSIVDEMRDKTWDQQRMSALQPWTMTWGKLFGAPSFSWYGGAICLAVAIFIGVQAGGAVTAVRHALTLVAVGVMMHAAVIALNLHTSQGNAGATQRGGVAWVVILLGLTLFPWTFAAQEGPVPWWHVNFARDEFLLYSSLFFAACTVFAAWRVMSNALQVRTTPWAWPLFACLLAGYITGFGDRSTLHNFFGIGVLVSAVMTYAALFSEPNRIPVWERVLLHARKKDSRRMLEHSPIWLTSLLLTFAFSLVAIAPGWSDRETLASSGMQELFPLLPVIALTVLRDSLVLLFFAFSSNSKRVEGTTMLYLVIINGLLPFLAGTLNLDTLKFFLLPFDPERAVLSAAIMAVHVAIALALVLWRWRVQTSRQTA